MRTAQTAPLYECVPPQLHAGTERIVSFLTEELVRRGHDVMLFASGGFTLQRRNDNRQPSAVGPVSAARASDWRQRRMRCPSS